MSLMTGLRLPVFVMRLTQHVESQTKAVHSSSVMRLLKSANAYKFEDVKNKDLLCSRF